MNIKIVLYNNIQKYKQTLLTKTNQLSTLLHTYTKYKQMQRLGQPKKKKKQSASTKILRFLKQIFAQHSHLAKYLPLMTQTKQNRVCRLINDSSYNLLSSDSIQIKGSLTKILFPRLRVFMPIQNAMLIWYWLVFFAIMYYFIQMGLVLTYGQQVWTDQLSSPAYVTLDILTILILGIDVLVCLNCGYLYRGMIIMDYKRITSRYMRTFAAIDLVSLVIVIACPVTRSYYLNFAKLWLVLKVTRLFQIDDFYLRRLNIHRRSKAVYVIFKLMVIIFLLSHLVGLIFYAMDDYLCSSGYYQPQFCWLNSATAYSPINSLSYPLQYLYTLYWGINTITTISYGDIAPMNPIQTNYAILCFCFGFMVYGYVVNQIVKIILWARQHQDQFRAQLILMDTYMQKMSISRDLRRNVHDYLSFVHRQQKNRDLQMEAKMIQKIPQQLRIQLLKNAYEIFYSKMLTIFYTNDIIRIFFYLTQKKFTHHENVFDQDNRANALFYVSKGKVDFIVKHGTVETKIYETQSQNQLIGHFQVFIRQRWTYSAITTASSLIYSIDRIKLMEEINSRAKLRERFKLIQYALLFRNQCSIIFYSCFFCKKQHHFLKCPQKFPIFNKVFNNFEKQQKKKRYQRSRTNTLILNKQMIVLRNLKKLNNFGLITKVEKRLVKIKRKIEQKNKDFQIDLAHDWEIYYPQANFSKLREKWNSSIIKFSF